jgi:hypothetical protein
MKITNLLQITINVRKFHRQLQSTLQLRVRRSHVVHLRLSSFLYAANSIQNESEQFVSSILLPFVNFALHPIPQTKIQRHSKQMYVGDQPELGTCSFELLFFSQ